MSVSHLQAFCFWLTLVDAAKALLDHGASAVSFFVVHAEFPEDSWRKFLPERCAVPVSGFFVTDSCADVAAKLAGKAPFTVISLAHDVKNFLDVLE